MAKNSDLTDTECDILVGARIQMRMMRLLLRDRMAAVTKKKTSIKKTRVNRRAHCTATWMQSTYRTTEVFLKLRWLK